MSKVDLILDDSGKEIIVQSCRIPARSVELVLSERVSATDSESNSTLTLPENLAETSISRNRVISRSGITTDVQ